MTHERADQWEGITLAHQERFCIAAVVSLLSVPWLTAAPSSLAAAEAVSVEAFQDDFDLLDRDVWFVSDGWANGPHQSCQWSGERVDVSEGVLRLALTADPAGDRDLSCAEVQSKARYGYGTFEARIKVPYASGLNANFFTFVGAPQGLPHNEIDFEFIARDGPTLQTNYHLDGDGRHEELTAMTDEGVFRRYAFIWQPDRIRWFIDGVLIREVRDEGIPDEPQKIYLSIWTTDTLTEWMGPFDPSSAPLVLEIDWVGYTPLGAECAYEGSVLCEDGIEAGG